MIRVGEVPAGRISVGLEEQCVGIAVNPYNHGALAPFREEMEQIRKRIVAGSLYETAPGQPQVIWSAPEDRENFMVISVLDFKAQAGA